MQAEQIYVAGVATWCDLGVNGTAEVIDVSSTDTILGHCYFSDGNSHSLTSLDILVNL